MIGYYVTMKRGSRVAWLVGPFPTKEGAETRVRDARRAAADADPRACWVAFGVTKVTVLDGQPLTLRPGVLNAMLDPPYVPSYARHALI